jgi:hypothetical protein
VDRHAITTLEQLRDVYPPPKRSGELPSAAEILSDHIGTGDVEASAAALADGYANHL